MSIAAAARKTYAVSAKEASPGFQAASATPEVASALEKITTWIPTEVIAIYVGLLGIFTPTSSGGKWVIFAIAAALVPAFVILNAALISKRGKEKWKAEGKQGDPPKFSWAKASKLVALAAIAYVAWTFALPDSPWLDLTSKAPQIGGAAVLILSLFMSKVAEILDLRLEGE
jgi:hypothetical protein